MTTTKSREGHVYLLRAIGTSRYKIGQTSKGRMSKRFEELNSSQAAFPIELIKYIDVEDRHQVEAELHQKFKAHRVHGEWFSLDRGKVKEVERVMGQYGEGRNKSEVNNWGLIGLIVGTIVLLMAWQSYQGDLSRQQIYRPLIEQED